MVPFLHSHQPHIHSAGAPVATPGSCVASGFHDSRDHRHAKPTQSQCRLQQEGLIEDCSRAKQLLMFMFRYILPYAEPQTGQYTCPYLRCREAFDNTHKLLHHMRDCEKQAEGEWRCPDCIPTEAYNCPKSHCYLFQRNQKLARKDRGIWRIGRRISRKHRVATPSPDLRQSEEEAGMMLCYENQVESSGLEAKIPSEEQEIYCPESLYRHYKPQDFQPLHDRHKGTSHPSYEHQVAEAPSSAPPVPDAVDAAKQTPLHAPAPVKPPSWSWSSGTSNFTSFPSMVPSNASSWSSTGTGATPQSTSERFQYVGPDRRCDSPAPITSSGPDLPELDGPPIGNIPELFSAEPPAEIDGLLLSKLEGQPRPSYDPAFAQHGYITQEPPLASNSHQSPSQTISADSGAPPLYTKYGIDLDQPNVHTSTGNTSAPDSPTPSSASKYASSCPTCSWTPGANTIRENRAQYLKKHQKTHEGLVFPCPICGHEWSRKDNLKTHVEKQHQGHDVRKVMNAVISRKKGSADGEAEELHRAKRPRNS